MLRAGTAMLLALATPAFGQATGTAPSPSPPASAGPPPEFIQAAQGFGQCIGPRVQAADRAMTPEAAADAALAACAEHRTRVEQAFETWLSASAVPAAQKSAARAQMKSQLDGARADIVASIRTARAAPPPVPATPPKK